MDVTVGSNHRQVLADLAPGSTLSVGVRAHPMEGPFFEETILVTPSRLLDGVQDDIVSFVRRCAAHLGLSDTVG